MSAEEQNHQRVVAIDGPVAAGKSTVARDLAALLSATFFDTGTLYRALTLAAIERGVAPNDEAALIDVVKEWSVAVGPPSVDDGRLYDVVLDGRDVTWDLRSGDVEALVSQISALPGVREALLPVQREIADNARIVMVGRDIGTVVVPGASVKIFLAASAEERARRRHRELVERREDRSFESVLRDLRARDEIDRNREVAPVKPAEDAYIVETDGRTPEEVVEEIAAIVRRTWASLGLVG